jgi:hypothetical protein
MEKDNKQTFFMKVMQFAFGCLMGVLLWGLTLTVMLILN